MSEHETPQERPESASVAVLTRNMEVLRQRRSDESSRLHVSHRIAVAIAHLAGSMRFVVVHALVVIVWVLVNCKLIPFIRPFDPSFVILATATSVEGLFLSTFILMGENRSAAVADRQAELDLQVNLLSEHEITHLLSLTLAIARHLGIEAADNTTAEGLAGHVAPEDVLDEMSRRDA